jgi:beta-glucanase (GH16 family)
MQSLMVAVETSQDNSSDYSTYLTLRTARLAGFQSAAEIDSTALNYHYVSARFLARVIGSAGACAGMFTYLANGDPQNVQEADIEILTSGPRNVVQYTNQPSTKDGNLIPQATINGTNPSGVDWTQWMVYRVDWLPKVTTWYVNSGNVARIDFQAPRDPAGLIINMWSDGGSWTGNMSVYDQAYLQIQWMEVVYNTSGPVNGTQKRNPWGSILEQRKSSPGCKVVCGIDEQVSVTGTPVIISNNTAMAPLGWKGDGMGNMAWLSVVIIGAACLGLN